MSLYTFYGDQLVSTIESNWFAFIPDKRSQLDITSININFKLFIKIRIR